MFSVPRATRILLAAAPVDMRKSIDGLAAIVRAEWKEDLFGGHLFAFVSRRGDRVKVLTWDAGGFALYYKRLERGRFRVPRVPEGALGVSLDSTQLALLLDGIDVKQVQRPPKWTPPVEGDRQGSRNVIEPGRWAPSPKIMRVRGATRRKRCATRSPRSKRSSRS
ncbi:MAG TPA: IS66 family insertion sequence element accessory protein TnpB [Usitatibacter sp.]|nr:IS66 family insertion sequence element accessory protein TnpB [Usitatibacter sp.]